MSDQVRIIYDQVKQVENMWFPPSDKGWYVLT